MRERLIVVAEPNGTYPAGAPLFVSGLTEPQATLLADAFLADALDAARHPSLGADVWRLSEEDNTLNDPLAALERRGRGAGEPGEWPSRCFTRAFEQGYRAVVVTAPTVPHLPVGLLQEAFGRLQSGYEAAVGPAVEQGNYLIALAAPPAELLEGLPAVREVGGLLEIAEAGGLRSAVLPALYDCGSYAGVARLWRDLRRGVVEAPESRRALATLFERGAAFPPQSIKEKS